MSLSKMWLKKIILHGFIPCLKILRLLPLRLIHTMGFLVGYLNSIFNQDLRQHAQKNIKQSGLAINKMHFKRTLFTSFTENGKSVLETFAIWFKSPADVLHWVKDVEGWAAVEYAVQSGNGLIFLTPHLGCFEITSLYYGNFHPITVLYRPPRQQWMLPMIHLGRQRGKVQLAPANGHGVKQLLQALKRGEAIGMLPDQAPQTGEGEWAPFFGRPAYTMTLASKLAQKTGAQVFMAFGERLKWGQGFRIHVRPIPSGGINTPSLLNTEIESAIKQCPTQYLWSYDRYKVRHQPPPPPIQ